MIITILEAKVKESSWQTLQDAYRKLARSKGLRPTDSFLVQNKDNMEIWRIISVWHNETVLQKVQASGETPKGVLVFREVGAEPVLSTYKVKENI